jgi:hypothetical protein
MTGENGTALGLVMLVHEDLEQVRRLVRHWAVQGGCPVVVHVDANVSDSDYELLSKSVADLPAVSFSLRTDCKWGHWSLVQATLDAARILLDRHPDVGHVALVSGSCVPLRPVAELKDYLLRHGDTDFIESVTAADVPWTIGGLRLERFTLRFPFSWKRRRKLFDWYVDIQRWLGVRRRLPEGIVPHLGSQWWCLTRRTLDAILKDRRRPEFDKYFRKTWIPDESYFQTLVRRVSVSVESRSLTMSKFDPHGKPFIFYDDHLQLLLRTECFIARKIWPGADLLYDTFLKPDWSDPVHREPQPHKIDHILTLAEERESTGRPGLYMQSRYPANPAETGLTARPYSVFQGFDEIFDGFDAWLARRTGARVHGHLFDWESVPFSGGEKILSGCLPATPSLRDYAPTDFLTNLIWNLRSEHQCFHLASYDRQEINEFIVRDKNAHIAVITGSWAYRLFRSELSFDEIRREAAWMQQIEDHFLAKLRHKGLPARVHCWSLAEFVDDPADKLKMVLEGIDSMPNRRLTSLPRMVDFSDFGAFLQRLKNTGMKPYLTGEFPAKVAGSSTKTVSKPYLIQ